MQQILYATGNKQKFIQASTVCQEFGFSLTQSDLHVPEIQGEDAEPIARDKATKAYAKFQQPLVISDDSWTIPGLNGFPGPYMKSVNDWFSVDDWLHLTTALSDRRIILQQIIIYQDGDSADSQQIFTKKLEGTLLREPRGVSPYPHSQITSFDGGEHSNAEFHERNESAIAGMPNVWHSFAKWYVGRRA